MNYFKGLIKCKICNKNYNFKKDYNKKYYICSTYKNYGKDKCKRQVVYEDDLIHIIKNHCEINRKELNLSTQGMKELIKRIDVYENGKIEIFYNDNTTSVWSNDRLKF